MNLLIKSPVLSYSMNYTGPLEPLLLSIFDIQYVCTIFYRNIFLFTDLLGQTVRNATGHVVAAGAAQLYWNVALPDVIEQVTSQGSGVELEHADALTLAWEAEFIKIGLNTSFPGVEILVNGGRSFGDISADAILFDGMFMAGGYFIMFVYTVLMLGRLNSLEVRLYLSIVGIICIGMGLIISLGLTLALGYPYTPMHAALPFIALGEMFDILDCTDWVIYKKSFCEITLLSITWHEYFLSILRRILRVVNR